MCGVCGCGHGEVRIEDGATAKGQKNSDHGGHQHEHSHADGHTHRHGHSHSDRHAHDHSHEHTHGVGAGAANQNRMIQLEMDILAKNNGYAAANRAAFNQNGILALNLVSSPGSGKTTLLVKTIELLKQKLPVAVVEGDQQTTNDADRIRATGVAAIQINTGKGCHLDAHMVGHAVDNLAPQNGSVLFIENVGNLVCPAGFDLGEADKVAILSVTEGEDKPLKYPDMFAAAGLVIMNKIDLLPHLDFDIDAAVRNALAINPKIKILKLSARTGEGMDAWLAWIEASRALAQIGSAAQATSTATAAE